MRPERSTRKLATDALRSVLDYGRARLVDLLTHARQINRHAVQMNDHHGARPTSHCARERLGLRCESEGIDVVQNHSSVCSLGGSRKVVAGIRWHCNQRITVKRYGRQRERKRRRATIGQNYVGGAKMRAEECGQLVGAIAAERTRNTLEQCEKREWRSYRELPKHGQAGMPPRMRPPRKVASGTGTCCQSRVASDSEPSPRLGASAPVRSTARYQCSG